MPAEKVIAVMPVYEFTTVVVGVNSLEESLSSYSRQGWEVVNILPSSFSGQHNFFEMSRVMVVLRNKLEG